MNRLILIASILFCLPSVLCAQGWKLDWNVSTQVSIGTGDYLSFWQRTYEGGYMPYTFSGLATAGTGVSYYADNGLYFEAGTHLVGSYVTDKNAREDKISGLVDRLYVSGGWKMIHLDVGMKPRIRELGDLSLTGGNITYSGYARNFPGINLWTDWIYFEKGHWFGIRGNFAHYELMDNRWTQRTMVHNKSLAFKFALGRKVDLEVGLDHWAQWGGVSRDLGQRPSSFKDFVRVVFARQGGADATASDQQNALGNHLGREYVRLKWKAEPFDMTFQYDMPFEDGRGMVKIQNAPDGVYTLMFSFRDRKALVTDLLYEYVHTTWQSGDVHDRPATEEEMTGSYDNAYWQDPDDFYYGRIVIGGKDNYFNNGEYKSGWTNHGQTIGLPLLLPNAPGEDGVTMGVVNNRVRAHHIGVKGNLWKIPYSFRSTLSSNWGKFHNASGSIFETKPWQLSLALEVELGRQVTDLPLTFAMGVYGDVGELYQNSVGLSLRIFYNDFKIW